jgi:hypothetical protein
MIEDNSHAGQGSVVIDVGGNIGALVVTMPPSMEGVEIEIRPVGSHSQDQPHHEHSHHDHPHEAHSHGDHSHPDHPHEDHSHGNHPHEHSSGASNGTSGPHPHVAVVARPTPTGRTIHSAVFPELAEGTYELYEKLGGPVELVAEVKGGEVSFATWPTG